METMLFADEVVSPDSSTSCRGRGRQATKRELDMARQLIESLSTDFDPTSTATSTASACST